MLEAKHGVQACQASTLPAEPYPRTQVFPSDTSTPYTDHGNRDQFPFTEVATVDLSLHCVLVFIVLERHTISPTFPDANRVWICVFFLSLKLSFSLLNSWIMQWVLVILKCKMGFFFQFHLAYQRLRKINILNQHKVQDSHYIEEISSYRSLN